MQITKRLRYWFGLVLTVAVILSNITGLVSPEQTKVLADPDPYVPETYTAIGGYSASTNFRDANGNDFKGFCLNSNRSSWSSGTSFETIEVNSVSDLAGYVDTYNSNPDLIKNLTAVLYYGYPNNASGLMEQYGLSPDEFKSVTQSAVWHFTNNSTGITGTSNKAEAYRALIAMEAPATNDFELVFLTNSAHKTNIQNSAILIRQTSGTGYNFTFEKVVAGGGKLGGATFTFERYNLTSLNDPEYDASRVTVTQNGAAASGFSLSGNTITFTTVDDYDTVFENVPAGYYRFHETAVPAGSNLALSNYYVRVSADGSLYECDSNGKILSKIDSMTYTAVNTTVTPTNTPTPLPTPHDGIKFNKTDNNGTILDVGGAVIELHSANDYTSAPKRSLEDVVITGADDVSYDSTTNVITFTTRADTDIVIDHILDGKYYFQEITAPEGYQLRTSKLYVTILADGTYGQSSSYNSAVKPSITPIDTITLPNVTCTPTPGPHDDIMFQKVDSNYQILAVGGAVIELHCARDYSSSAEARSLAAVTINGADTWSYDTSRNVITFTTLPDQPVTINNILDGIYYMVEIEAPDGYRVNATKYFITILNNGTYGQSASFRATPAITPVENLTLINITATATPSPSPTPGPVDTTLRKTDLHGTLLEATFVLGYNGDVCTSTNAQTFYEGIDVDLSTVTIDNATNITYDAQLNTVTFTTVHDMQTTIHGLYSYYGYYLTEISVEDGYYVNDPATVYFMPDSDGRIGSLSDVNDTTPDNSLTDYISVINTPLPQPQNIVLSKTDWDEINYMPGQHYLGGATFAIHSDTIDLSGVTANGVADFSYDANTNTITFTTIEENSVILQQIMEGTYVLVEVAAPEGFLPFSDTITLTVLPDGTARWEEMYYTSANIALPNVSVTPSPTPTPATTDVTICKVDQNSEKVADAWLMIHPAGSGNQVDMSALSFTQNGTDITIWPMGSTVYFQSSGDYDTVIHDLPEGTYVLEEYEAPADYEPAAPITFKVTADGTLTDASDNPITSVTMTDTKINVASFDVSISKQSLYGTDELAGASFRVYNDTGSAVDLSGVTATQGTDTAAGFAYDATDNYVSFTSVSTSRTVVHGLTEGSYVLEEIAPPGGYLAASPVHFTVDDSGNVLVGGTNVNGTIIVKDTPITYNIEVFKFYHDTPSTTSAVPDLPNARGTTGARLVISNDTGNNFNFTTLTNIWQSSSSVQTYENISRDYISFYTSAADNTTHIEGIAPGNYVLTETDAPEGFAIADPVHFTITDDGKILVNGTQIDGLCIGMEDPLAYKYDTKIRKYSYVSAFVPGTKLVLGAYMDLDRAQGMAPAFDSNLDLSKVVIANATDVSYDAATNTITFTTTDNVVSINNLAIGRYYLQEIEAAPGYALPEGDEAYTAFAMYYYQTTVIRYMVDMTTGEIDWNSIYTTPAYEALPIINATATPTPTATNTPTPTATNTPTATPTATSTPTATVTPTATEAPSATPTDTPAPTSSDTMSASRPTSTLTPTPTETITPTPTEADKTTSEDVTPPPEATATPTIVSSSGGSGTASTGEDPSRYPAIGMAIILSGMCLMTGYVISKRRYKRQ